ncbi:MAG TPA: T9SS type A sorting domain-containing protein [Chitinophagales bacterium]|nr:T9SS type A sorting domain-containing protein [Chitinophagales bacterium]
MDKFIHTISNKQLFILVVLFFCSYTAKADYSVQLRVAQWCVSGSHDCDGWTTGDSDFQVDLEAYDHSNNLGLGGWDNCSQEITNNNSPGCRAFTSCNTDVKLDDRLFLDWRFRLQEDDLAGGDAIWGWVNACFVPDFSLSTNTWRTMVGFPKTASIADSDCSNSPVPYSITVEWKLTGSSSAPANDLACNATQIAMGGASANLDFCESTGGINGTNVGAKDEDLCGNDEPNETEGRTVWYKFTTGATISNRASILVENRNAGDNMTPWVAVYRQTGIAPTCAGYNFNANLLKVGQDDGTHLIDNDAEVLLTTCAGTYLPNTTYYIQIEDEGGTLGVGYYEGNFRLTVKDGGYQNGPNDRCDAYDLGTYTGTLPACSPKTVRTDASAGLNTAGKLDRNDSFTINRESTRCANGSGSPNSPNKDVWYKFTTGNNIGSEVTVQVNSISDLDAFVGVYKFCATSGCPTYATLSSNEVVTGGGYSIGGGPDNATAKFAPEPNTTYYVQVDGYNAVAGVGGGVAGDFNLTVSMNNTRNPYDDICNAETGTQLITSSLGLGQTVTVPGTLNNNNATNIEGCNNEPKASGDDATVWFSFQTGAIVGSEIKVQAFDENASCGFPFNFIDFSPNVYKKLPAFNCNTFAGLSLVDEAGLFGGGCQTAVIDCPEPNTWYYVQIQASYGLDCGIFSGCETGTFKLRVIDNGVSAGPDFICQADSSTVPGVMGNLGVLNSSNNTDLVINNQTTRCATVTAGGDPDHTTALSSLNSTVWYKFRTPAADYVTENTLFHLYDVVVERLSSSSLLTYPAIYLYQESANTVRTCGDGVSDYNNLTYLDRDELGVGDASIKDLCLKPNTNYYLQVDPVGIGSYVDFNVKVKKSAFRPGDQICNASVIPTSVVSGLNKTTTISNSPMTGAPFFGLPHSNKCKSADPGEPDVSVGGPGTGGSHSASVWYQFTTDASPAEWLEWDHDDYTGSRGVRGTVCTGLLFNTKINIYKSKVNNCVYPSLQIQSEYDLPWETINKASIMPGIFRLRCPEPNTTYYVQVKDAGASPCFEGVYAPKFKTAPTTRSVPVNDDPCGAIHLGAVAAGGTLAPTTIFDNFCSTPTIGFIADQSQPTERDVWFTFIAPPSGSVLVTAQSAPAGSPSADNDIDLQIAIWEPILGDANLNPHCSSPRYLWTPIISRDHDALDYLDAGNVSLSYYDILDTRNNLVNEGNSLIATCLNPGKMYYMQVDGGEYPLCDFTNGGDCTMGYFKLQVKDAGLYDMASMGTMPAGNDEPCGAKTLPINPSTRSYGSLNWMVGSNLCATAINDPVPSKWFSSDATVWYKFTAPPSGKVKIRAENINQINKRDKANPNSPNAALTVSDPDYHEEMNLQLALYTMGNCLAKGTLAEHSSSYDGILVENNPLNDEDYVGIGTNGFDEYMVAKCLIPGREYYIMVDGENDPTLGLPGFRADIEDVIGDFRISVQDFATVPASLNDNVCDAFEIMNVNTLGVGANRTTGLFNNECATIEPNIEGSGKVAEKMSGLVFSVTAKKTLWFKFRAPSSGKVKIEGINSGNDKIDIALAVYDFPGENCNLASSGFKFAEDYDPAIVTFLEDEEVTVECLVPGRYYYLQVDGSNNTVACLPGSLCATGEFRVKITHLAGDARSDVAPQKNDNLCDAINLGNLNPGNTKTRSKDNNRCSTEEINEPGGSGWNFSLFDNQERSVWYRFKTGLNLGVLAPGKFTIVVDNPDPDPCFDIDIELFEYSGAFNPISCNSQMYSNSQFNRLLKVGKGTPISLIPLTDNNRSEKIEIDCPRPNTEYFLRVSGSTTCPGFGATMGDFDVKVSMDGISIMAAENDDICGSMTSAAGYLGNLSSGGNLQRLNHNNFCATQELGEPNTTQNAVQSEPEYDETMWYRFRTPVNPGEIKVKLETVISAGFFSVPSLTVYKGQSASYNPCSAGFGGLIEVASDFGAAAVFGTTKWDAEVTLPCPSANWNYFIQVDGMDASLFGFTIPGFDDNFIYNVKVSDDGSGSTRPVNDKIQNALPVDSIAPLDGMLAVGGSLAIKGHNLCATADDNEPRVESGYNGSNTSDHQSALEDETVWYYFTTPNKPGIITVRVQDDPGFPESFSPNFAIFYNNGTNPTYRVTEAPTSKIIQEGSESVSAGGTNTSRSYTCLLPNTKYYIQVDGNDIAPGRVDQGHFIVTVTDNGAGSPGPSNDLICDAENLTTSLIRNGTATFNRTNYCSWEEMGEPNTSGNMGGTGDDVTSNDYDETVWFKFRPSWEGQFEIDLSTRFNFILYRSTTGVYNCNVPVWDNLTRMSSSSGVNNGTFSCLDDNVWYYIQVDGIDLGGDDVGPFTLSIKHVDATIPNHDMICYAYDLGTINNTTGTAANQNNICATEEVGEPNVSGNYNNINATGYDKTLWYRFRTPAQTGDWTISVTNNSPFNDRISGTFTLYQGSGASACAAGVPVWTNLTERKSSGIANVTTGNNSLSIECFRLQPNTFYFLQVQGEDLGIFGEVGTNFNVSVTHSLNTVGANDNVCSAQALTVGAGAYTDNNICATSQLGEPNVSPLPQDPFTSGYDETMWYKFVAPPNGYVKIEGRSLSSNPIDLNMTIYELPQGATNICTGGNPNWSLLSKLGTADNLTNFNFDYENECLIPGRTYFLQIDGGDAPVVSDDRGNYTIRIIDNYIAQGVDCAVIPNDEPCGLSGAYDISAWVRENRCTAKAQFYATTYTIFDGSPDIDCATRSPYGLSCGSRTNCSDYWFQFTVPDDSEGGVKIQGNDEFGISGANNSTLVIGAYRGNPCTGQLQFLGCDHGGFGRNVEFDIAAIPGEQIYLQVFNDAGAANPTYPNFGMCISTQCAPKSTCSVMPSLEYDIPQCWNLDEDGSSINDGGGIYGNCIPGGSSSANYFTFSTECGETSDGEPDTLTVVYSVTNISSNTALAIYEDATPCDGLADAVLINCVPFGTCIGCSPSTTFTQTYQLDECKTYVIQILGEDDDDNGSSGQIFIFKTNLEPPVLPIELLSFTGYHDGQNNVLNWMTASEKNADQFIIERSIDGNGYSAIGIVGANGNSTLPQNYSFYDPEFVEGNNYYRLKIVDFDGKFEYSNVIIIDVSKNQLDESATHVISVYPNPTDSKTNVEMYVSESNATFQVKVLNLLGQVMTSDLKTFSKGVNKFEIDASNYAQGAYVISIVNKTTSEAIDVKFVKQ